MLTARSKWDNPCRILLLLGSVAFASRGGFAQQAATPQSTAQQPTTKPETSSSGQSSSGQSSSEQSSSGQSPSEQSPSGQTPAAEQPPKIDWPNAAEFAAEKTKEMTVEAAEATKNISQQALVKARDWESGLFTGTYVGEGRPLVPLTTSERREIYLEQTLTTPGAYLKRMFAAGIDQARGAPYQWDDGWAGYMERFASREGQFITANSLAYLGNSALKYEPRYDQCRCQGFWPRTRHAILRNFITYDGSERHLRPQLALYGGAFGGGLVSTAWKPKPRNAFAEGSRAAAEQGGYGALLNIFIEFSPDFSHALGARKVKNR